MKSPTPNWHIAQQNLRLSPYFAAFGGLLAAVLAVWTPLCISYLALAVGVGVIGFFIQWLGVRRRMHLGFVATILTVFAFMIGREHLLPHDVARADSFLCVAQFMGVWMFTFAALHIVFRKKLKRDFEIYAV
jgi:hypothetical protein